MQRSSPDDRSPAYLALAREIHDEVQRTAADPDADLRDLERALDEWPAALRADAVTAAFRELPRGERWTVLADLFDDDELRAALALEHEETATALVRTLRQRTLAAAVRTARSLDTCHVAAGDELVLGLFRPVDVRAALPHGPTSTACARRLVLRATGDDGAMIVIDDEFNPRHGLFVTAAYDDSVWRAERLDANTRVRVGTWGDRFEPIVLPAGRVDVETADGLRRGHLHAGAASIDGVSLFSDEPS